jgi:hypothetical protein
MHEQVRCFFRPGKELLDDKIVSAKAYKYTMQHCEAPLLPAQSFAPNGELEKLFATCARTSQSNWKSKLKKAKSYRNNNLLPKSADARLNPNASQFTGRF